MLPTPLLGLHSPIALRQSDEESVNRVLLVLATLIKEIHSLKSEAEGRFYDALLFYGEGIPAASSPAANGVDNQMAIAKFLPLLQDLSVFVSRCVRAELLPC